MVPPQSGHSAKVPNGERQTTSGDRTSGEESTVDRPESKFLDTIRDSPSIGSDSYDIVLLFHVRFRVERY